MTSFFFSYQTKNPIYEIGIFPSLTWQSIHVDPLCAEADAHVAVPALGNDLDLEVVDAAGRRDGVRGADRRRVLVRLTVT